jgi:putative intracellular protease/amidase
MRRTLLLWILLLMGSAACSGPVADSPPAKRAGDALPGAAAGVPATPTADDRLPAYQPRFGRHRPLVAVVAENYYTELTDYVVPYGILAASGAADVVALATQPGPVRMFPAPMKLAPQATTAAFDARHPEGADYVIVPAVHRDDDPALLAWVAAQAHKGATIVGVCDGVWVLAHAGLLEGRRATGHWYSFDDLRKQFPQTDWQRNRRYVADGKVITTTGVTATIPISLALVEAIAGHERAASLAVALGRDESWSSQHPSERFSFGLGDKLTIAGNFLAFWSHQDVGIPLEPGVDEIALALQAEVYSATYRSRAYTVAHRREPVTTLRGLAIIPDRVAGEDAPRHMLPPPDGAKPLRALDEALKGVATAYGPRTAAWVALQIEYPGY